MMGKRAITAKNARNKTAKKERTEQEEIAQAEQKKIAQKKKNLLSQLCNLGLGEFKSDTEPGTFAIKDEKIFDNKQLNNTSNTPWRRTEYVFLLSPLANNKKKILSKWTSTVRTDSMGKSIRKLCAPTDDTLTRFDVYDASGTLIKSGELNEIIGGHTLLPPAQIAYYGVPGSGKSFRVNNEIDDELKLIPDKEYHKIRCVFHPDYSNADFVGQILPTVDGKEVRYEFHPGPFAKILRRAYLNPDEPFFLIIEEINRGNAAAIFGETFQLLDRIKSEKDSVTVNENKYGAGWSSYCVDNLDVNAYIRDKKELEKEQKPGGTSQTAHSTRVTPHPCDVKNDEDEHKSSCFESIDIVSAGSRKWQINANTAIRLPPNLSIYATMNTSDQNVFAMDNAFQRRFKSKMIPNNLDKKDAQYKIAIAALDKNGEKTGSADACWGEFREWINGKILGSSGISSAEDKQLGGWFISADVKEWDGDEVKEYKPISREDFAEKVIKYLWNDVFKRESKTDVFKPGDDLNSFSKVISAFENAETGKAFEAVFNWTPPSDGQTRDVKPK